MNEATVARLRSDTPGCDEVIHLNNAGASLPPAAVLDGHFHAVLAIEAQGFVGAGGDQGRSDFDRVAWGNGHTAQRIFTAGHHFSGRFFFLGGLFGVVFGIALYKVAAIRHSRVLGMLLFAGADTPAPHPNHLRLRLGGGAEGIELALEAEVPGESMATQAVPRPNHLIPPNLRTTLAQSSASNASATCPPRKRFAIS